MRLGLFAVFGLLVLTSASSEVAAGSLSGAIDLEFGPRQCPRWRPDKPLRSGSAKNVWLLKWDPQPILPVLPEAIASQDPSRACLSTCAVAAPMT